MNVLFDLDGTLTDPRRGFVGCVRHALTAMDRRCPPDTELVAFIGPPLQQTFAALLGGNAADVATAVDLYRQRFSRVGMFENAIYPGIEEALQALKRVGAALFVATSKPAPYAKRILEHFRLSSYFDAIHGSELDGTRAEKRELIAHVLTTESLLPAATYVVGDREHDVKGAVANRLRAVGVLWGYGTRDELVAAGASSLCEQPSGLAAALDRAATAGRS
jgi:phosphoglycolate phosphatase